MSSPSVLIVLVTLSFFSLAFIGLMPALAASDFGIAPRSVEYGLLYGLFGLGAALGAVSVGTWFAHQPKARLIRPALAAFGGLLAGFALLVSAATYFWVENPVRHSQWLARSPRTSLIGAVLLVASCAAFTFAF